MNSEQFVYWLQGFSEIEGASPTPKQWKIIQDHLNLVFTKVTPKYTQEELYKPSDNWALPFNPLEVIC